MRLAKVPYEMVPIVMNLLFRPIDDYEPVLEAPNPTPVDLMVQREEWERLSQEARELAGIIFECPKDIINLTGSVTKQNLIKYLRGLGWKYREIDKTFGELKEYVRKSEAPIFYSPEIAPPPSREVRPREPVHRKRKVETFTELTAKIKQKGESSMENIINLSLLKGSTADQIFQAVRAAAEKWGKKSFKDRKAILTVIHLRRKAGWVIEESEGGVYMLVGIKMPS